MILSRPSPAESPQLVQALAQLRRTNPWRFTGAGLSVRTTRFIAAAMTIVAGVLFYLASGGKGAMELWANLGAVSIAVVTTAFAMARWQRGAGVHALLQLWVAAIFLVVALFMYFD